MSESDDFKSKAAATTDAYELLTIYAWHRDVCDKWFDPMPDSASQWGRYKKHCPCGFADTLARFRTSA